MNNGRAARVAALFVVAVSTIFGTGSLVAGCAGPSAAPPDSRAPGAAPSEDSRRVSASAIEAAIAAILTRRAAALSEGDRAAWLADLSGLARIDQADTYEALRRLPLESWSYGQPIMVTHSDDAARLTVPVHYKFRGEDQVATVTEVLEASVRDGEWTIDDIATGPVPPWNLDDVAAAEGEHSLVVGSAPPAVLRRYAADADAAVAAVDDVWDQQWTRRVSLLVPANWSSARDMIGAPGDYAGYAALTGTLEAPGAAPGPVRILANQHVLEGLSEASRRAVLAHEAFHAASWGTGRVPKWLSEGLGDYIGFRASQIGTRQAVAGLLAAVRANPESALPQSLPPDAEFSGGREATVAYEGAYLAVRMLVQEYGTGRVTSFYRDVAGEPSDEFARLFQQTFRVGLDDFTARWRREISRLARTRTD